MLVPNILPLQNLINLLHTVIHGDLVWEIRGEHKRLMSDAFNHVRQYLLIPLAAYEKPATPKIFFGPLFDAKAAIFQLPFQPVDNHGHPARPTFQKPDP